MSSNFNTVKPISTMPDMEFMYIIEYINGSIETEHDSNNGKINNFSMIQRNQLLRMGIIGHGNKMYYDVPTGIFHYADRQVEILYKDGDTVYNLTNQMILYNDPIYFQEAYSDFNAISGKVSSSVIYAYDFGYKTKLNINGVNFSFKPIMNIPCNQPLNMKIRLVADKDLNGQLIIKVNNMKTYAYDAPLKANIAGELTWVAI